MKDKIIKIPISFDQRQINIHGTGYVPCEVTERWLQFPEESQFVGNKELMFIDVMTYGKEHETRKLCSLCLSREDILRALNNVKVKNT